MTHATSGAVEQPMTHATSGALERRDFDVVVVGGGPAGATAAHELAREGLSVCLLDKAGRIKPCGGAVPPQLLADFAVPDSLMVARVDTARMVSPRGERVDIPVGTGYVGMVDRGVFDEWLRERARAAGAERRTGIFQSITREAHGRATVHYVGGRSRSGETEALRATWIAGADGALSSVARDAMPEVANAASHVFAYHEVVKSPTNESEAFGPARADVYYDGRWSPDFYSWVFPHGETTSIGTGSMQQGFKLRDAVARLRAEMGLADVETVRCEGAPIPLRPLSRWDNGRDVILAGDAAGVVAPASGEGIFYAMTGGRRAAEAVIAAERQRDPRLLRMARRRFMREHGQVFWILDIMQRFWYSNDSRRERFVTICKDRDVQVLTFEAYMCKRLVVARPLAHIRIFLKNIGHLAGVLSA